MHKLFYILLLLPAFTRAQEGRPRFEYDTLYTSCGYKIYEGSTVQLGSGTRKDKKFRYINIKSGQTSFALANKSIEVKELKNFGISSLGNAYIEIIGRITFSDGSKGLVDLHVAFDLAIENNPDLPGEIIVPAEYRNNRIVNVTREIDRLYKLYQDGAINKTEYEKQKNKLLQQ
ncbi:MAG: SHOCT domain-containing protein [Chitinophagaceae bacterium]|nr:SHOCT domain-containing protein [Chitinophagaceae bacterium]